MSILKKQKLLHSFFGTSDYSTENRDVEEAETASYNADVDTPAAEDAVIIVNLTQLIAVKLAAVAAWMETLSAKREGHFFRIFEK